MSIFDWLGPISRKRSLWDFGTVSTERKLTGTIYDHGAALTVRTLIHGPGASDLIAGWRGNDSNSAVFACLQLIATSLAEAPLKPYKIAAGERIELDDQPIAGLLERPNPHMTFRTLLGYLSHCLHVDGNGYWRKLRAGDAETGNVVELWPINPTRIEPRSDGAFISHYRYYLRPGKFEDIPATNVVHFRMGLDPDDHRLGRSPLKQLAAEVSSDEHATRYADRLLANFALPGISVEWDKDTKALTQDQAEEIKARIQAAYGGDNVGSVSVLSPGARLAALSGFSPEQMNLRVLHQVPEERIAAVLGTPAAVVGLGAGLEHSIYNNVRQAEEHFTERKMVGLWADIADTLTLQLLPDFSSDRAVRLEFDLADVRALSEDEDAKAVRLTLLVEKGVLTVDEARAEWGLDPLPEPATPEPSTLPEPTPLRALPLPDAGAASAAKAREIKAADDLPARLGAMRDAREPDWIAQMQEHLDRQAARVSRTLRSSGADADALVPDLEAEILGERLRPLQMAVLSDVHALVIAELAIAFQLDDPTTRAYLEASGTTIRAITETTREAVRAALIEGQAAGEGIDALARRLRGLPAFDRARAETVARTELGISQNLAALTSYRASGVVVGVRVHDGDGDAACAAMNGRTFKLGDEPPSLQHPRCRRAFAPIVDAAELSVSA